MWNTKRKRKSLRGQSIAEYGIVLGIVAAALAGMQVYAKRAIQAAIKVAADEVGGQRKGAMEFDFRLDWKIKGQSEIGAKVSGSETSTHKPAGEVVYDTERTVIRDGKFLDNLWVVKE